MIPAFRAVVRVCCPMGAWTFPGRCIDRDSSAWGWEVCFFQAGGMVLGLSTALGGHGAPGIELAQNVRAPEEVAVVLAEAEQAGGKIVRPAARAEWGGMSGAFADPDGYVWEVAHNPGWTITDDGSISI
jgi:uncharacterized protein